MAACRQCGGKIGFFGGGEGLCSACLEEEKTRTRGEEEKSKAEQQARAHAAKQRKAQEERDKQREKRQQLQAIVLTTEVASNLSVLERKDIVIAHADCSLDVKLKQKKDELLQDLREQAYEVKANAVVGITFSVEESYAASIGAGNIKKFKLIAYGTAVQIE